MIGSTCRMHHVIKKLLVAKGDFLSIDCVGKVDNTNFHSSASVVLNSRALGFQCSLLQRPAVFHSHIPEVQQNDWWWRLAGLVEQLVDSSQPEVKDLPSGHDGIVDGKLPDDQVSIVRIDKFVHDEETPEAVGCSLGDIDGLKVSR